MRVLYSIFIFLFRLGIYIAAIWNAKARAGLSGRKRLFEKLETTFAKRERTIWMHCASAGEFEQGKPIIEKLKNDFPSFPVVVSFFSPSGFSVGRKYNGADHVVYLPLDTAKNARRFVAILNPALVIFIKYDYWYFHLKAVADRKTPLLLASALFRKEAIFFKPYGSLHRCMLHFFQHIFVQDQASKNALRTIDVPHCTVAGDTRFDRVNAIALKAEKLQSIEDFILNHKVLVAGSTWPHDENLIASLPEKFGDLKIILAPHEVSRTHIHQLQTLFPKAVLYSQLHDKSEGNILIIDNIGMLSRLYQYAAVTYIGGGFNRSGIHNTLEAAVWGKPVIFGPHYQKFKEAKELIEQGGGFSVNTGAALIAIMDILLSNEDRLFKSSRIAEQYVKNNTGATQKIMDYIQENRLLTTP